MWKTHKSEAAQAWKTHKTQEEELETDIQNKGSIDRKTKTKLPRKPGAMDMVKQNRRKMPMNEMKNYCFWCCDEAEVQNAEELTFDSYDPCDECKEKFESGVLIIEVDTEDNGNFPLGESPFGDGNVYPTGRYFVVKEGVFDDSKAGDHYVMTIDDFEECFEEFVNAEETNVNGF